MKFEWNRKYSTIAAYAFLTAAAIIALIFCIVYFPGITAGFLYFANVFKPITYALIIAYLLNSIEKRFHQLFVKGYAKAKKPHPRMCKVFSILSTYILVLLFVVGFSFLVIPQLVESGSDLSKQILRFYNDKLLPFVRDSHYEQFLPWLSFETIEKYFTDAANFMLEMIPHITSMLSNIAIEFKNILLGVFISIYFLAGKDTFLRQAKKITFALLSKTHAENTIDYASRVDNAFGCFIRGKLLDSLIIGVLCFVAMTIFRMPYAMLISVIVGITNVIPIFGPFIGAIPSAFIIFIKSPITAFWFLVMVFVLQQLDGNYIGPKVLGDATGLSATWILISLTIMGSLYGIVGMLIAIPIFSLIYEAIKAFTEKRLEKKGLPTGTENY